MTAREEFIREYKHLCETHGMFVTRDIYDEPMINDCIPIQGVTDHLKRLDKAEEREP